MFLLGAIGLGHIFVDGLILIQFKHWLGKNDTWLARKTLEMMSCYQCAGTWSGFIVAIMLWLSHFPYMFWLYWIVCGFAASFMTNVGAVLISYFNIGATQQVTK